MSPNFFFFTLKFTISFYFIEILYIYLSCLHKIQDTAKSLRGNSLTVLNENIIHLGNVLEYSWLHPIKYLAYLIKKVFNISNKVVEVNNDNNNGKSKDEQIKLSNKKDVAEKVAEPKNEEKN